MGAVPFLFIDWAYMIITHNYMKFRFITKSGARPDLLFFLQELSCRLEANVWAEKK